MAWKLAFAIVAIGVSIYTFWSGNIFTASITKRIDAGKMRYVERIHMPTDHE